MIINKKLSIKKNICLINNKKVIMPINNKKV